MRAHTAVVVQCDGTEVPSVHHSGRDRYMLNVGDLVHVSITHEQGAVLLQGLRRVAPPEAVQAPQLSIYTDS